MKKVIWIAWEKHRRNQSICSELNLPLHELETHFKGIIRYLSLGLKTLSLLFFQRPKVIFAMNPSIILALLIVFTGRIFRKKTIIDAHNIGVQFENTRNILRVLGQFLNHVVIKNATFTLVTNESLKKTVEIMGGRPFVLPDPFPVFERGNKVKLKRKSIFYICTYAEDEPYLELFKAAEILEIEIYIYVSGRPRKDCLPEKIPQNIIITGFLNDEDYISYLHSCDLVVDLTYRENCLLCGGYEAIAAEQPLLLSDHKILREYFGPSALYCKNEATDIAERIEEAFENLSELETQSQCVKEKRGREIRERIIDLQARIFEGSI